MYFKRFFFFALIIIATISASCKKEKTQAIAKVGKTQITSKEIQVQLPEAYAGDQRIQNEVLNQYLYEVLLYNAAKDEGFLKNEDLQTQLKVTTIKVVSQFYLNEKLKNARVSEEELRQEFEKSKNYFQQKVDMVVLYFANSQKTSLYKQILLNPYPVIVNEVNKLSPNEAQVAPISENLGVIYYSYGEDLFNIISKLKLGEISDPIPLGQSGYYALIKILKLYPDKVEEQEIKEFLNNVLVSKKQNQIKDSILTALTAKYPIQEGVKK